MKCVLCGKTSIGIQQFAISPGARDLLEKQFPGVNPDEALASYGICGTCLALQPFERRNRAERVLSDDLHARRRDLLKIVLEKLKN